MIGPRRFICSTVCLVLLVPCVSARSSAPPGQVPSPAPRAHAGPIHALAVTPDGKLLASASEDATIKLWSIPDGRLLATLKEHTSPVNALAISRDGRLLVSGAGYAYLNSSVRQDATVDTIRAWSLPDGRLLATINKAKLKGKVFYVLSPHGSLVDTEQQSGVLAVALAPDGKLVVSGARDTTVRTWALVEGSPPSMLADWGKGHARGVQALAIAPDGQTLASGSSDKTIRLWSLPDGRLTATLEGHTAYVSAVAFTPDGKTLVSASREDTVAKLPPDRQPDNTIRLWSVPEGRMQARLEGHTSGVTAIAVAMQDGAVLASGSRDRSVRLWALPQGQPLATLEGHAQPVTAVAVTPDGKLLISADEDGVIVLWDPERREFLRFASDPAVKAK